MMSRIHRNFVQSAARRVQRHQERLFLGVARRELGIPGRFSYIARMELGRRNEGRIPDQRESDESDIDRMGRMLRAR